MNIAGLHLRFQRGAQAFRSNTSPFQRSSYAQCGEDLIVANFLQLMEVKAPVYLDLGANHPVSGSNTFYFDENGCRGVCVEPNPKFRPLFARLRPTAIFVSAGVAGEAGQNREFFLSIWMFSPRLPRRQRRNCHTS